MLLFFALFPYKMSCTVDFDVLYYQLFIKNIGSSFICVMLQFYFLSLLKKGFVIDSLLSLFRKLTNKPNYRFYLVSKSSRMILKEVFMSLQSYCTYCFSS